MEVGTDYETIVARTAAIKTLEEEVHKYLTFHGFAKVTVLIAELAEHWVHIKDFDFLEHLENMIDRSIIQSLTYTDTEYNRLRRVLYPNNFADIKIGGDF